jgi:hypothetical protein
MRRFAVKTPGWNIPGAWRRGLMVGADDRPVCAML